MFRLSLYPIFDSYLLVAVVALLLAGLMWFGPSREKIGRRHQVMLALVRAAVIALMVLAMLRPTLIYMQTKKQSATLVVLADQSRSMSVPDAVGNKTRWQALRGALANAAPALAKLQRDFELKSYAFDTEVHEANAAKAAGSSCPKSPRDNRPPSGRPWRTCWAARRASGCWASCS